MAFIATGKIPTEYSCYTFTSADTCLGRHVAHSGAQTRPLHEVQFSLKVNHAMCVPWVWPWVSTWLIPEQTPQMRCSLQLRS